MKRLTSIKKWHFWGLLGVLALGIVVATAIAVSLVSNDLSAHGGDARLVHACVNQTTAQVRIAHPGPGDENTDCTVVAGRGWSNVDWGIQGPPGIIPEQSCLAGQYVTGFDAEGNVICTDIAGFTYPEIVTSFIPGDFIFGALPPATSNEWRTIGPPDQGNLSLGLGGEITLRFVDNVVVDGEGNDLQINAFFPGSGSQELDNKAQVWVSTDGSSFTAFPGFIGPGGPSFSLDLAMIAVSQASYVKIVDSGECCLSGNPNGGGDGFNIESVEALNSALP